MTYAIMPPNNLTILGQPVCIDRSLTKYLGNIGPNWVIHESG